MAIRQPRAASAARQWQAHVRALERSGLSRAEYCRRHNLSYHALRYWQLKLRQMGQAPVEIQLPTLQPVAGDPAQRKHSGVSIRLDSGVRIELDEQFSSLVLGRVLQVLKAW